MNKRIRVLTLLILVLSCFSVFAESSTRYVKLDTLPLRANASALADKKGTLYYGNAVKVLETKNKWVLVCSVQNEKIKGWVPSSSLVSKKLKEKQNSGTADAKEIALAGKGFTESLEAAIESDQIVDYTNVDKVESCSVSEESVIAFLKEGSLNLAE